MPKKLKLLIVANNAHDWQSWPDKMAALLRWFAPKVDIQIELEHTSYDTIPFIPYDAPDGTNQWLGVKPDWYDMNIAYRAADHDIVLFVVPVRQWAVKNKARGWRYDMNLGPIELQIAADEHEHLYERGAIDLGETFHLYARHEIMHALFMMTGQEDRTHYWWDRGRLENALYEIEFPDVPSTEEPLEPPTLVTKIQRAIIDAANQVISLLKQLIMEEEEKRLTRREKLLQAAVESLGKEMSPQDLADDNVACAESLCNVVRKVVPDFPMILGTAALFDHLKKDRRFRPTLDPNPGNIIISPTIEGGPIRGHVGIHLGNERIASNTSKTGLWEDNFSIKDWISRYRKLGGMRIYYFELV